MIADHEPTTTGRSGLREHAASVIISIVVGALLLSGAPFWVPWVHLQADKLPFFKRTLPTSEALPAEDFVVPMGVGKREDLWVVSSRTRRTVRALTSGGSGAGAPTLSPDRKTVFYTDQAGVVHAVAADGTTGTFGLSNLKDCPFVRHVSVAAQDPDHILLQCRPSKVGSQADSRDFFELVDLWGVVVRVIRPTLLSVDDPTLSPDGTLVAFWGSNNAPGSADGGSIFTIMTDGTAVVTQRTVGGTGVDADPAWSPNGRQLAFRHTEAGSKSIYRYDLRTARVTRVSEGSADQEKPSWSTDGKQLVAVTRPRSAHLLSLTVFSVKSRKSKQLPLSFDSIFMPAWAGR